MSCTLEERLEAVRAYRGGRRKTWRDDDVRALIDARLAGWSEARVGLAVGMSASGVGSVVRRRSTSAERAALAGQNAYERETERLERLRDIRFRAALNYEAAQSGIPVDQIFNPSAKEPFVCARKRVVQSAMSTPKRPYQRRGKTLVTSKWLERRTGFDHSTILHAQKSIDREAYEAQVASRQKWGW